MKTTLLLLVSLSVVLSACSTEDEVISPLWGIDFSAENSSGFATGSVEQFIGQSKTTYIIKTANLRCSGGDVYSLLYTFETGETMELKYLKEDHRLLLLFSRDCRIEPASCSKVQRSCIKS